MDHFYAPLDPFHLHKDLMHIMHYSMSFKVNTIVLIFFFLATFTLFSSSLDLFSSSPTHHQDPPKTTPTTRFAKTHRTTRSLFKEDTESLSFPTHKQDIKEWVAPESNNTRGVSYHIPN